MAKGTAKTVSKDLGESRVRAAIAELKRTPEGPHVKAGVLEAAGAHKDGEGLTVADVAVFNEFGTATIPERGFMRAAAAELVPVIGDMGPKLLSKFIEGTITLDAALDRIGLKAVSVIKRTIRDWTDPPNAPSTIRAKARKSGRLKIDAAAGKGQEAEALAAFNNPLEDTGQLRNSIDYVKVKA